MKNTLSVIAGVLVAVVSVALVTNGVNRVTWGVQRFDGSAAAVGTALLVVAGILLGGLFLRRVPTIMAVTVAVVWVVVTVPLAIFPTFVIDLPLLGIREQFTLSLMVPLAVMMLIAAVSRDVTDPDV